MNGTREPSPCPAEATTVPTEATTVPPETTEETVPPTTQPADDGSYIVTLLSSTPIYRAPNEYSEFIQYVGVYGAYTIVEEAWDQYGNLWGRLKSGVGWVMLSDHEYCADCGIAHGNGPHYSNTPYIVTLYADTPIYKYPSYNSAFLQYVGLYGAYTIVEECWDHYGNLWGKLKSGAGWVLLY
ncbi:MAG: hypothetical protein IKM59_05330 [Oscillospiraceae bacterium]|nr:hypothetical protein [Oscillospiraceae bacterium]